MQSGTIRTAARMMKTPCAARPRVMTMMPMMMAAIATGQTRNHAPQPMTGMSDTTNVIPSRAQLTRARVRVPLRAGWTIEAFGRIGAAVAAGCTGAGDGVGAGVGAEGVAAD